MGVAVGGVHRVLRSPLVVPRVSGAKLHGSPKEPEVSYLSGRHVPVRRDLLRYRK